MAQWLSTWDALPKNPGLISSKYTWQLKIISDSSFIHTHSDVLGLFIPVPPQPPFFSANKTDKNRQRDTETSKNKDNQGWLPHRLKPEDPVISYLNPHTKIQAASSVLPRRCRRCHKHSPLD